MVTYCEKLANEKLSTDVILRKREFIKSEIIRKFVKNGNEINIKDINTNVLKEMINLYDIEFFDNAFKKLKIKLILCWNNKCCKVAGRCWEKKRYDFEEQFEHNFSSPPKFDQEFIKIELSYNTFKQLDFEMFPTQCSNGIACNNFFSCLQIVLEHEMVHAIMNSQPKSCYHTKNKLNCNL